MKRKSFETQRFVVRLALLVFLLCVCMCFVSCARTGYVSQTYFMMDTVIEIKLLSDSETAQPIFSDCGEMMRRVEQALSRTDPESTVARFNAAGEVLLDKDTAAVLKAALDVFVTTEGAFDPSVERLIALWSSCAAADRLPTEQEMSEALLCVDASRLTLSGQTLSCADLPTTVDLGGIGKGYAIDQVIAYLKTTPVSGGVVSFGGNIAVFGAKPSGEPYRIGLKDPSNTSGVLGYLEMESGVISVSGDYERYVTIQGQRYHHILDPQTGYPADNGLRSVAVICENGALADALSTALFVMGREKAMEFYRAGHYEFEAIFVTDGEVMLTDGLASSHSFDMAASGYTLIS